MHSANREFVTSCCHGGKFPGWQQTDNATWKVNLNTPFPSSIKSHFQNEAKCETFVVKMSFICIIIKNHFHVNGFALSLALKVRFLELGNGLLLLQWNSKWLYQRSGKEKEICLVFSSSTKREIRHFHVPFSRARTAKECTKKREARAKLLFC